MPPVEYIRQGSEASARENFRANVAERAKLGNRPRDHFPAHDLLWGFDRFEDELDRLDQVAVEARQRELEETATRAQRQKLHRETERVLAEWDAADARERRERAEVEAKRRLGL